MIFKQENDFSEKNEFYDSKTFENKFIKLAKYLIIFILIYFNKIYFTISLKRINPSNKFLYKNQINLDYIEIKFDITNLNLDLDNHSNIIKLSFNIRFYNKSQLIPPSTLLYSHPFSFLCFISIKDSNNIYSIPYIIDDKFFSCIEFFKLKDKITSGIKLFFQKDNSSTYYIFDEKSINYKNLIYKNEKPIYLKNESISSIIKDSSNKKEKFKNLYSLYPLPILKRCISLYDNIWYFQNIFNHYFCFCRGNNCNKIEQICKFYFYLNILDNNRHIYKKTHYLLDDLLFDDSSSDDSYPVFQEMNRLNFSAHYLTEDPKIYSLYCSNISNCRTIIPFGREIYNNYGDFVEKYLGLLLKLKIVVSGRYSNFHLLGILFYHLEYIKYISMGHGVCYFKDYLYKDDRLYGINKNNKIVISPSIKIISLAKKYGWKDDAMIKINLPKWDIYNIEQSNKNNNNSILIMFTWRDLRNNKIISLIYMQNILNLITDKKLNKELEKYNITLYYCFHRFLKKKNLSNYSRIKDYKYIKQIHQKDIFSCLSSTNLVVTDFSSIIFDLMYRNKPFILYLPDYYEKDIESIYTRDYIDLIESYKGMKWKLENQFFTINETVNKIIYYIKNNFLLDGNMKYLYKSFGFKKSFNTHKFINILKSL